MISEAVRRAARWRSTAVAAAASGGATIAPSAIAPAQGMSGTSHARDDGDRDVVSADRDDDQAGDRPPVGRRSRSEVS